MTQLIDDLIYLGKTGDCPVRFVDGIVKFELVAPTIGVFLLSWAPPWSIFDSKKKRCFFC